MGSGLAFSLEPQKIQRDVHSWFFPWVTKVFQYTCYESSYITQCTEFVRIFPTNANGWCCQDIDLRLVFSGLPSRPASAHAILGCRSESSLAASLVSKTPATALNTVPWFGIVDKFRAWFLLKGVILIKFVLKTRFLLMHFVNLDELLQVFVAILMTSKLYLLDDWEIEMCGVDSSWCSHLHQSASLNFMKKIYIKKCVCMICMSS